MAWDVMEGITELMPHLVQVSKRTGVDRYGKSTYGTPMPVRCLLSGQQRLVRSTDGSQQMTSSVLYCYSPDLSISPDDKVVLPDGTDPPILNVGTESDEHGVPYSVTVYLG